MENRGISLPFKNAKVKIKRRGLKWYFSKKRIKLVIFIMIGVVNMSLIINVPFSEKDEVKLLGAKWSPTLKKWYVEKWLKSYNYIRNKY